MYYHHSLPIFLSYLFLNYWARFISRIFNNSTESNLELKWDDIGVGSPCFRWFSIIAHVPSNSRRVKKNYNIKIVVGTRSNIDVHDILNSKAFSLDGEVIFI